jgi:hypothetical protein
MTCAKRWSTRGIAVSSSNLADEGGQRGLDPFIHGGDVGLLGFDVLRHPLNRHRGARGIRLSGPPQVWDFGSHPDFGQLGQSCAVALAADQCPHHGQT